MAAAFLILLLLGAEPEAPDAHPLDVCTEAPTKACEEALYTLFVTWEERANGCWVELHEVRTATVAPARSELAAPGEQSSDNLVWWIVVGLAGLLGGVVVGSQL